MLIASLSAVWFTVILSAAGVFASAGAVKMFQNLARMSHQRKKEEEVLAQLIVRGAARTSSETSSSGDDLDIPAFLRRGPDDENVPVVKPKKGVGTDLPKPTSSQPPRLLAALLLVAVVFAISIAVIWSLTHIGGPIEASVKTTIEKAGGSILIVGSGLFGAFFAVSLLAFAAIHVFSRR